MANLIKDFMDIADVALAKGDVQTALYYVIKANVLATQSLSWQVKLQNEDAPIDPAGKWTD